MIGVIASTGQSGSAALNLLKGRHCETACKSVAWDENYGNNQKEVI
jgi:hypothetical protein